MSDVLEREIHVVIEREEGPVIVVTEMEQGPPGPGGALLVANRLSELSAAPEVQQEAQRNLGLGVVDPVAYYILAKS